MENEFPPNNQTPREARPERRREKATSDKKEVTQITKGKVTLRKKPLHKKFMEAFRPEDNKGFVEYTLLEVLVPAFQDGIVDAGQEAIANMFGRSHRGHGRGGRSGRGSGYTSYNRMGSAKARSRDDDDRRSSRRGSLDSAELPEIILDSRVEADHILDTMIELISAYDVATVRDLKSMIGERHEFTDEDWGWSDLRGARVHHLGRHGYLLDLPRPEALD